MRNSQNAFHLAIPCGSLEATKDFYERLGCRIARQYEDRLTMDFFGDQVVCHLSPDHLDSEATMYPRHFGVTFREQGDYSALLSLSRERGLPFFQEPFLRFQGRREEHRSFFLVDPSNNVLEFKYYNDPDMMY